MAYAVSTIYGEGQKFYESINQGSMYMEVSYTNPLKFDSTLTITEPRAEAINLPTVTNYATPPHNYFMGSFDGFWVHKLYKDGNLIYTIQGVDQELFIPISYDRIESVSMPVALTPGGVVESRHDPCVPSTGTSVIMAFAAMCALYQRKFFSNSIFSRTY